MREVRGRYFETMLAEGRVVELRLQEYFKQNGYVVVDKSEDTESQKIGVDFIIRKEVTRKIEVKTDSRLASTGNLFIEHKMVRCGETYKGWLHTCEADFICYHDSVTDEVHLIAWEAMRKVASGYPPRKFKNMYDVDTIGHGYIVPLQEAKERGLVVHTYSLAGINLTNA